LKIDKVPTAFAAIHNHFKRLPQYQKFKEFFRYYEHEWIKGVIEEWNLSLEKDIPWFKLTNNCVENFHGTLFRKLNKVRCIKFNFIKFSILEE
jgi:hypothetical protein